MNIRRNSIYVFMICIACLACKSQKELAGVELYPHLKGRTFVLKGYDYRYKIVKRTLKEQEFKFVDDTLCIYTEKYNCKYIDEPYRTTTVRCRYKIIDNNQILGDKYPIANEMGVVTGILLENLTSDTDSATTKCYRLPNEQLLKSPCFKKEKSFIEGKVGYMGPFKNRSASFKNYVRYSQITNITSDTVYYIKPHANIKRSRVCLYVPAPECGYVTCFYEE